MIPSVSRKITGVAMGSDKESASELLPNQGVRSPLRFQMRMPSDPRLLAVVRSAVAEFAAVWGFEDEQCRSLVLAIDEALSNVIRHAYKNRCDQEIDLDCQAREDCLEFTFTDRGESADPAKFCGQPLNEVSLGGRGTHLIREIMDEVCYEPLPGRNRLCLKKRLPGAGKKA
jgi:anti-sigma regulatory factor (Ser/Thr protein kinase)